MPSLFAEPTQPRSKTPVWINAHCDGGARGNPGPAGYGAVITDDAGNVLAELSEFLGHRTNNFAEYSGLLGCLQWALDNNYGRLNVTSDSELMVKQIQGKYKVNSPDLKPLWEEAKWRISKLDGFKIVHALRHKNRSADKLANDAMDRGMKDPNLAVDFTASLPKPLNLPKAAAKEEPKPSPVEAEPAAVVPPVIEAPKAPEPEPVVEAVAPVEVEASEPAKPVKAAQTAAPEPVLDEPAPAAQKAEPKTKAAKAATSAERTAPVIVREGKSTAADSAASRRPRVLRGVCRDGVIHIIDGERLSNGTFVSITVDMD